MSSLLRPLGIGLFVALGSVTLLAVGGLRIGGFVTFAETLFLLFVAVVTPMLVGLNDLVVRDGLFGPWVTSRGFGRAVAGGGTPVTTSGYVEENSTGQHHT